MYTQVDVYLISITITGVPCPTLGIKSKSAEGSSNHYSKALKFDDLHKLSVNITSCGANEQEKENDHSACSLHFTIKLEIVLRCT